MSRQRIAQAQGYECWVETDKDETGWVTVEMFLSETEDDWIGSKDTVAEAREFFKEWVRDRNAG